MHWVSQVCREQPIDLGACESHLMAGDVFTKCFGHSQKWYEVMKLISHMPWSDFLKLSNQGNEPYPQDAKKEITKTEVKKEEIAQTLRDDSKNQERMAGSNG